MSRNETSRQLPEPKPPLCGLFPMTAVVACAFLSLVCSAPATYAAAASTGEQGTAEKLTGKKDRKPVVFKLRLQHPWSAFKLYIGKQADGHDIRTDTDMDSVWGGFSLGLDIKPMVALEIGADFDLIGNLEGGEEERSSYHLFVRGGLMPTVADNRGSGDRGATLQLGALVG